MLDLNAMKAERGETTKAGKKQVKTFLTDEAKTKLETAAKFVGCPQHDIIEELILTQLPRFRVR